MTTDTLATEPEHTGPTIADQGKAMSALAAGYVGHRTIAIGLRQGLLAAITAQPGATPASLAAENGLDELYVSVWCRSALAAGVVERDGAGLRLAPHLEELLLDPSSPAYVGGIFTVLEQPEIFDRFEASLASGERTWWDDCSPDFIAGVASTGGPFYARLIPSGLAQVPGLAARLERGGPIVDTACGSGTGIIRLARSYPRCQVIGVDGDTHSLERAEQRCAEAGVVDRVRLVHSPLEQMALEEPVALVVNNISMHECRDIDQVAAKVWSTLEPGGWFVISDFPFPDTDEGLRSVPGKVMAGIQFFEAQIDDQLLPRSAYDDLLLRHGFTDLGWFQLSPVHAVTFGRRG